MADDDDVLQSVQDTENELLQGAFEPPAKEPAKEAPAPEPKAEETPAAEEPVSDRQRDPETGRFVSSKPAEGQQQEPAKEEEILPSWRAREINDERRAAQAEVERLRVENARLMGLRAQQERVQQPQQPEPLPDPVLDPQKFYERVRQDARSELLAQMAHDRLNQNLEL